MENLRLNLLICVLLFIIFGCRSYHNGKMINDSINIENIKSADSAISSFEYDSCKNHPSYSEKRTVLSLRNLIKKYKELGGDFKETVKLESLGWIEGYVIDKKNEDILFFGRENVNWPDLYVDDLMDIRNNVLSESTPPYCSLDPIPQNVKEFNKASVQYKNESPIVYYNRLSKVWGDQKVVVGGVSDSSNIANVMLEADYHMKKISQGLDTLPNIESLLDISTNDVDNNPEKISEPFMSRFWFKCDKNSPVVEISENIVFLKACDVIVRTEAQGTTRNGELFDSGEINHESELFADDFSRNFRFAATHVNYYAQLENLYRLLALMKVMHVQNHLQNFNSLFNLLFETCPYVRRYNIPKVYRGLTNRKVINEEYTQGNKPYTLQRYLFVCGGVEMNPPVSSKNMYRGGTYLNKLREQILTSRVDNKVSWTIDVDNLPNYPKKKPVKEFRDKKSEDLNKHNNITNDLNNSKQLPSQYQFKEIKLPEEWQLPQK
jgi:hypothetical protein